MAGQSSFPGFEEAKPTDRLFLALFPPPETALEIAELATQIRGAHALRGRPLEAARFHVTLNHLGDYAGLPPDIVRHAGAAAAEAAAATQPFAVSFDRAESFASMPRNRPLVLRGSEGLADLMAFHQVLGAALKKNSLGQWAKPSYTPHMTLLYDDSLLGSTPVASVAWTAGEVVLVHSLLGETRHVHLARWPLSGPSRTSAS